MNTKHVGSDLHVKILNWANESLHTSDVLLDEITPLIDKLKAMINRLEIEHEYRLAESISRQFE